MRIERLGIEHKDLLMPRFKALAATLSEYTFANLYLFRKNHEYEVLFNDELLIRGRTYDNRTYLMPTADPRTIASDRWQELLAEVDFLFPVPEAWLGAFPADSFDASFSEGDADYVYTVEKMSTYKGRNLHKKRNLLKQFQELYAHDAKPLTNDRLADARAVVQDWLASTSMEAADTDYGPCLEALERYDELVLCGGIVYADNEPAGFLIGEELDPATFVLHFAKARTRFKGVYQYLFNNFAGILPPKYRYLNLEQDLDRENLRVFKSSYVPDAMLRKARVALRRS
jgi:hypothetical protein